MRAECQCGKLSVRTEASPTAVVVCHCIDCQRRTGSLFGNIAFYPADQTEVAGDASRFERLAASGGTFQNFFCPNCGSTVYVRTSNHPTAIGVPVGTIADPDFPGPVRSVWEQSKHKWVEITGEVQHFPRGRS
jgi:hypothetical protein